jgi:tRNA (cytidine/uridine-2'-O-)-methyltransferase
VYPDFDAFLEQNKGDYYFITRYGEKSPDAFDFTNEEDKDIYIIFGSESSGIPKEILQDHLDRCLRLPMTEVVRSLNLSNTVAVLAYEVLRQQGYKGLFTHEPESLKGKDYLKK